MALPPLFRCLAGLCVVIGVNMGPALLAQPAPSPKPRDVDDVIANILRQDPVSLPAAKPPASVGQGPFVGPAPFVTGRNPSPADAPIVMGARIGESPGRSRFVIELSQPIQFRTFTLTGPN